MKKVYADLHLCPNLRDLQQVSRMAIKASKLGYHLLAIPFPPNCMREEIERIRGICNEVNIDLASRVDLRPRTPDELIRNVRKLRRKFEIVAVLCESKDVARQAAKDRRVDLLSFPSRNYRLRFFDMAEAELAAGSLAALEIDIEPLVTLESPARTRVLSSLRKETAVAQGHHVPVVLSSGVLDELLMRKPMELAALSSLFDLRRDLALSAVSQTPRAIVRRNREKLDSRFVAPGIRVVRRGKDC